jgi:hypothetical protein
MSKASASGRTSANYVGKGVPGGSPKGPANNPPPISKGGTYSSYMGKGGGKAKAITPVADSAPYKTEGKPLGKANGNIKIGGSALPSGEQGPEKISGSGKMAKRSYK